MLAGNQRKGGGAYVDCKGNDNTDDADPKAPVAMRALPIRALLYTMMMNLIHFLHSQSPMERPGSAKRRLGASYLPRVCVGHWCSLPAGCPPGEWSFPALTPSSALLTRRGHPIASSPRPSWA